MARPARTMLSPTTTGTASALVALGEEFLLADLLALGIEPVASTATTADAGFQGLDDYDTRAIQPLASTEPNFERLASLRPDTIVAAEFVIDVLGREQFDVLGDLVVVPTAGGAEQLEILGKGSVARSGPRRCAKVGGGRSRRGRDRGRRDVRCRWQRCTPVLLRRRGLCNPAPRRSRARRHGLLLSPSTDDAEPDGAGRVRLSLEQLGMLDAPRSSCSSPTRSRASA